MNTTLGIPAKGLVRRQQAAQQLWQRHKGQRQQHEIEPAP
jgi:hypothetical protein